MVYISLRVHPTRPWTKVFLFRMFRVSAFIDARFKKNSSRDSIFVARISRKSNCQ